MNRKSAYPTKTSMNLFYKPDRTTKPATVALYVLFALTCLLGLSKLLVYDLWAENREAQQALAAVQDQLDSAKEQLSDYSEVRERYSRYSATEEERALIDRLQVLDLLDQASAGTARLDSVSISGDTAQVQFSGATLAQTAQIIRVLESSPMVSGTVVNTAATTESAGALVQTSILIYLQKEVDGG